MISLEQRRTVAYSDGGTPIMSQMISIDSGAARLVAKSHSPRSATRSIRRSATSWMVALMPRTCLGVKAPDTMPRRRAWRGLSVETIPVK